MALQKTILLAEDYEPHAALIQTILKQAGVCNPVIVVTDGDEVVAYLKSDGMFGDREKFPLPSVLLLDLKMPRMGGFEVLEWCKAQPHLKEMLIVVLSGHHELPEVNRAYALGAHSFLVKPSSREEIANLVKRFTGYWELGAPPLPRTPSSHNEI